MVSLIKKTTVLLVFMFLGSHLVQAQEPVLLQYKFSAGKPLTYLTRNSMTQTTKVLNQETKTEMETEMFSELTLNKQEESGLFQLEHHHQKFKTEMDVTGLLNYKFDSETPKVKSEGILETQLDPVFKKLGKAKLSLSMQPNGKVVKVTGYQELLDEVLKTNPFMKQFLNNFSDESAQTEFSEMFPELSPQPVKPGDSWEIDFDQSMGEWGSLKGKKKYRYLGNNEVEGRKCVTLSVDYNAEINLDLDQGLAKVKGTLKITDSKGTIDFDPVAGEVVQVESLYKIAGNMKVDSGGRVLDVETNQEQKLSVNQINGLSPQ